MIGKILSAGTKPLHWVHSTHTHVRHWNGLVTCCQVTWWDQSACALVYGMVTCQWQAVASSCCAKTDLLQNLSVESDGQCRLLVTVLWL